MTRQIQRIALVWPKGFLTSYAIPMALAYLKANIDECFEVKIFDNSLLNRKFDSAEFLAELEGFAPDIVGVSAWTPMRDEAINILSKVKAIDESIITIMGGVHATFCHRQLIRNKSIDYVIRGEAEKSFNCFLHEQNTKTPDLSKISGLVYLGEGEIVENPIVLIEDLDTIVFPDYRSVDFESYLRKGYRLNSFTKRSAPIWVTRGCPYACKFCSSPLLNGVKVRKHSAEYIINGITQLKNDFNADWINIVDDNFTFDVEYAKSFCRKIIDEKFKKLKFGTPCGVRMQKGDSELWQLMKNAGWEHIIIAPESGSIQTLKNMNKKLDLKLVPKVISEIKRCGLKVQGFFMLGYPGESEVDLEKTYNFIVENDFDFVYLADFQPIPGTPVYNELLQDKQISEDASFTNFTDGDRFYIPPELKGFNFSRLIFKIYLKMLQKKPARAFYFMKIIFFLYGPKMILNSIFSNVVRMFKVWFESDRDAAKD